MSNPLRVLGRLARRRRVVRSPLVVGGSPSNSSGMFGAERPVQVRLRRHPDPAIPQVHAERIIQHGAGDPAFLSSKRSRRTAMEGDNLPRQSLASRVRFHPTARPLVAIGQRMLLATPLPAIPAAVKRVRGDVGEMPIPGSVGRRYDDVSHIEVNSRFVVRVSDGVTSTVADPIYTCRSPITQRRRAGL